MVHTRDPGSVEAGRTGAQEHPQLQVSLRSACATRDPTNTEQEINSTFTTLSEHCFSQWSRIKSFRQDINSRYSVMSLQVIKNFECWCLVAKYLKYIGQVNGNENIFKDAFVFKNRMNL